MTRFQFQLSVIFILLLAAGLYTGCTDNEDFANPLDPKNLRTAGSPIGLDALPGDKQVKVSWQDLGHEGIVKYRIYRRFTGDLNSTFERIGEVVGKAGARPPTEFIDTQNIKNDQFDAVTGRHHIYIYRISYVDEKGVEAPDPDAPPDANEQPQRIWPTVSVTPSIPPPAPNVILGDELENLTVKLLWQDYQPPEDFQVFRVFAAESSLSGEFLPFRLLAELPRDRTFFFDQKFERDETPKIYRVVAVDRFGVEGVTTINAVSPNLPPAPPQNARVSFGRRLANKYDVRISWSRNKEPDLDGYQIYATKQVGGNLVFGKNLVPRRKVDAKDTSVTITGEDFLLDGQRLTVRRYFITAFDNTARPGRRRDDSEMVEALP